ncbi:hypothetical protein [uncultured Sphingomonas sp.]|jgi:hypothetical protein|uniref:hypothetical protein n=1 Tax=uncultured Sphingomonas sp. TaxID=158754 RepID=UPI00262B5D8F|nr:hypothetical protein [uncultured Sphingomonas sp.]
MTDPKPEYLTDTDKQTIKAMDGEDEAAQSSAGKSPQEDPGSPGGTGGTGGTANEQDD